MKAPFSELVRLYNVTNNLNLEPRYNIPPTEDIAVMRPDPARTGRRPVHAAGELPLPR